MNGTIALHIELTILALGLLIVLVTYSVLLFKFFRLSSQLKLLQSQITATELLNGDLQMNLSTLHKEFTDFKVNCELAETENSQVSKQLEHRIKTLQQEQASINSQLIQVQEQQPQDKFYTRANKLAEKGADVEEIMAECDLPRAEVEMLLAIHKQGK
ncbi:DUF2802 domain-containing protein [Thalassotalea sp. M1531]|uniref:DUF2802 domain-containing protein n=1 Tax=Thalassotalea algicola TaxID=2716224 RepID=A0A7Y0LEA3_9GAMM|nr:DUF2802 domain-containing protein [Thalassotalea algicola]NMP32938.1 DUF2802 domain-containing protein [Thalassotalea algicola]